MELIRKNEAGRNEKLFIFYLAYYRQLGRPERPHRQVAFGEPTGSQTTSREVTNNGRVTELPLD